MPVRRCLSFGKARTRLCTRPYWTCLMVAGASLLGAPAAATGQSPARLIQGQGPGACPGGTTVGLEYHKASFSVAIGNAIVIPPTVTVTCSGSPDPGADVNFAVTDAGAQAELPGPQSAIANAEGLVTPPPVESGLVAGKFSLRASADGASAVLAGTVAGKLLGIQLPKLPPEDIVSFYSDCPQATDLSPTCLTTSVDDIDVGRHEEHLGPLVLPTNFTKLTPDEQLFTVINLERTAHGLPVITGLAANLDAVAQQGADHLTDATPIKKGYRAYDNTAAVDVPNAIAAVFFWVYDDGLLPNGTSGNGDCTPTSGDCWSHRKAILTNVAATGCLTPCVMGTGYYHGPQGTAYTTDFEYQLNPSTDPMIFTWSSELPYLPACERAGDTCTAPTTPPSSIYPAGECPAPGYDHTAWPSVSAVKTHIANQVSPGGDLAVTLANAAPGHVAVTIKHGSTTVASTALLYCASTVHLNVPVPATQVRSGDSLLVSVTTTEDRSLWEIEKYISVS